MAVDTYSTAFQFRPLCLSKIRIPNNLVTKATWKAKDINYLIASFTEKMTDPAFAGVGKKVGLEIWRIENKVPVPQPVTGKFHTGDSYILLSTSQSKSGALSWAIHFWLGEETSVDEAGIAAYKSVELDESLGGGPVQYREVQGNESQAFLALFKNLGGVEYLPGGVESGFKHVDRDVHAQRLLHVKGKRTVRVTEVPLAASSLNTGDVFILDIGTDIYIYNGASANRYEKAKGVEVATKLRSEHGGKAEIHRLEEDPRNETFWNTLGGYMEITNEGEDDSVVAKAAAPSLYRISDASGSLTFSAVELPGGKLVKSLLDSGDVYLIDVHNKVYVWVGRGASAAERRESMVWATKYIGEHNYPRNTPIERVAEGAESAVFKSEFASWDPPRPPPQFGFSGSSGVAKVSGEDQVDMQALLQRQQAADTPVDDGSGKLEIWRIEDFKKVPLPHDQYGQFFGGDSYVLLYTYLKNRVEEQIIYFWQGNESSADEKGASALLAKELDDSLGGRPVQVRVVQGKEPSHFRQLFKGAMIVHKGGKASGFKNRNDTDSTDTDGVALFHVKGTNALNTVAVQVEERAERLNSGDCFVLVTPSHVYVWQGRGATADEQAVATNAATILAGSYLGVGGREVVSIAEGAEPGEFWAALGGQAEYPELREGEPQPRDPRLFHCSNATGHFRVEEIVDFDQSDLIDDDVMILDCYTTVFVWVGSQSNDAEKSKAVEFAQRYVSEANDGRDEDIPIVRVPAGAEPVMFTSHFVGWDASLAEKNKFVDPYQAKLDQLAKEKAAKQAKEAAAAPVPAPEPAPMVAPTSAAKPAAGGYFSYEDLKNGIPAGVDPVRKEDYLEDSVFATVFGCSKVEFSKLPKWKQAAKKKETGLF